MQLTWLGTAGFKVDTREGATILIDPFLSRPEGATPLLPIQLTDLAPIDEIFLTNGRFDHAMDTPALVEQTGAIVHAPELVCDRLAELGVPVNCLQCVSRNQKQHVGSLTWQALAGRFSQVDSSPVLHALIRNTSALPHISALDRQWPLGTMVTYLFQIDSLSLIHFGSAGWIDSEIDNLQPDIALLPVESNPGKNDNVAQLAARLKSKLVIPHHWDNYYPSFSETVDLTGFEAVIQTWTPHTRVYKPEIGKQINLTSLLS